MSNVFTRNELELKIINRLKLVGLMYPKKYIEGISWLEGLQKKIMNEWFSLSGFTNKVPNSEDKKIEKEGNFSDSFSEKLAKFPLFEYDYYIAVNKKIAAKNKISKKKLLKILHQNLKTLKIILKKDFENEKKIFEKKVNSSQSFNFSLSDLAFLDENSLSLALLSTDMNIHFIRYSDGIKSKFISAYANIIGMDELCERVFEQYKQENIPLSLYEITVCSAKKFDILRPLVSKKKVIIPPSFVFPDKENVDKNLAKIHEFNDSYKSKIALSDLCYLANPYYLKYILSQEQVTEQDIMKLIFRFKNTKIEADICSLLNENFINEIKKRLYFFNKNPSLAKFSDETFLNLIENLYQKEKIFFYIQGYWLSKTGEISYVDENRTVQICKNFPVNFLIF